MSTATAPLMTAEEFIRDYGDTDGYELDRGQLVRIPMPGGFHGEVCVNTSSILRQFVKSNNLGRVAGNDTYVRVHQNPSSYRGADVLYVSYERLPKDQPMPEGPLEFPPDLFVEVRSPTDRLKKVQDQGYEYLEAGVKAVVIIDPKTESVGIFRLDELPMRFHNGDLITLPDVLPGFAAPVKAFFE